MKRSLNLNLSLMLAATIGYAATTYAAGYEILLQGSEAVSHAFAGSAGGYEDASSVFFNPAAMCLAKSTTITNTVDLFVSSANLSDTNSSVLGQPASGDKQRNGGIVAPIPAFFAISPLNDKLAVGFQLSSPFGLATDFDPKWVGRYQADETSLRTVNVGGALSYKLIDSFALGAGLGAIYGKGDFSNAVDFGSIATATLGATTANSLGLAPQKNDGYFSATGEDWAPTFQLGALYNFGENNRSSLGIAYKGRATLHLHGGEGKFDAPDSARILTSSGAFADSSVSADVLLPESFSLGGTFWVTDDFALLYESRYTRWNGVREFRLKFENPLQPDSVTPMNWDNTWRHSIGVKYKADSKWELRSGFSYDMTPVPNREFRGPRLPENDVFFLGSGISYKLSESFVLDLSYMHAFLRPSTSDKFGETGDRLQGNWNLYSNNFAASLTWIM